MRTTSTAFNFDQRYVYRLLLFWSFGFGVGVCAGGLLPSYIFALMRMSFYERVSIVGALVINFLTLFLTVLAVRFKQRFILYMLCIIKALAFGLSLVGIGYAFGSAGWLIFWIVFIPLFIDSAVFLRIVFRNREWDRRRTTGDIVCSSIILLAVVFMDYLMVSPFITGLLN